MRTVDLIQRKRDGEELAPEEIEFLVDGYTSGEIPDYQMSAFLMAVFFSGMTDREVSRLTECMLRSGDTVDLSAIPGVKVDKHSTGGVGDKTSLIVAPLAAAAGVVVPMMSGRALGHTGGTLDKLESIPGFRTNLTRGGVPTAARRARACASSARPTGWRPADRKLYALRDVTATVESIPLIASSIMSKKLAEGVDALVLDVKVGSGAFMKKQVDARRLAQTMVGIGRRMDKKVQALITDMNQPLGYAVGNALEVMEASQTLQNAGPGDLTKLCLELAARMIFLGKKAATLDEARRLAEKHLVDGSGVQEVQAGGGGAGRQPAGARQVRAAAQRHRHARGHFAARRLRELRSTPKISALASNMIGAGRDKKEDAIDPAVGIILEVKIGEKVDAGSVLCRLYYTKEDRVEEAAGDGGGRVPHFRAEARRARTDPGSGGINGPVHRVPGPRRHPGVRVAVLRSQARHQAAHHRLGPGLAVRLRGTGAENRFRKDLPGHRRRGERHARIHRGGREVPVRAPRHEIGTVRRALRLSGAADHHLHRLVLLHPLLPGHDAVGGEGHGPGDAEGDGGERRGVAERGCQHFHGPDGSAADHSSVPGRHDAIRAVHGHDERDGARFGIGDGGVRVDCRSGDHSIC